MKRAILSLIMPEPSLSYGFMLMILPQHDHNASKNCEFLSHHQSKHAAQALPAMHMRRYKGNKITTVK
jgi:hypothetical protein